MIFSLEKVLEIYKVHQVKGSGAISAYDVLAIQEQIIKHKPQHFLELGTASGMSSWFISTLLENNEGKSFDSVDKLEKFYADKCKDTGFLLNQIMPSPEIICKLHLGQNSCEFIKNNPNKQYDMVFIDANHQHPWPTLDMITILPNLVKEAIIIHHDLIAHRKQIPPSGIGPKYLFDQIPEKLKSIINLHNFNTYKLTFTDKEEYAKYLSESILLPWNAMPRVSEKDIANIRSLIIHRWANDHLLDCFDLAVKKYL